MNVFAFILAAIALAVVVPLWIVFHFLTKWRAQRGLTAEDERMLADLWASAKRMESRIANLEKIVHEGAEGRPKETP